MVRRGPVLVRKAATERRSGTWADVTLSREVRPGHPVDVLAGAAEHAPLVVGRRGHEGFAGMRLGSVPHGLLHRASCPVVTVPAAGAVFRGAAARRRDTTAGRMRLTGPRTRRWRDRQAGRGRSARRVGPVGPVAHAGTSAFLKLTGGAREGRGGAVESGRHPIAHRAIRIREKRMGPSRRCVPRPPDRSCRPPSGRAGATARARRTPRWVGSRHTGPTSRMPASAARRGGAEGCRGRAAVAPTARPFRGRADQSGPGVRTMSSSRKCAEHEIHGS
ncbi:universal stress protein [Streptomyces sp. WMMC940]|uniref:universal stress protein n=1 Tax=Streptomyces sp. WMMC940 TaxID=3015153 RepID=UPI003FCC62F0